MGHKTKNMKKKKKYKKKRMPSIDRNSETTCELDRISKLPDSVIYLILFSLPAKDAARTTVLSKDWLRIWHLLPVCQFVFDQSLFESNLHLHKIEKEEKVQKFIDFVNESLSILLQQKVIVQSFTLNLMNYRYSISIHNRIIDWLLLITKYGVRKLTLNEVATQALLELEAPTLWAKKKFGHSKLSQRLKCLQELSLTFENVGGIRVENRLDDILSCCSSLETLILRDNMYRRGHYLSLRNLCAKNIRVENIYGLKLSHATRHRVQISGPDLQSLDFCHIDYTQHFGINVDTQGTGNDEVEIHIDALFLRQLSYSGDILVSFTSDVLNFSRLEQCHLKISPHHDLNTSWFIKLRKFLEKLSNADLTINIDNDALFQGHATLHHLQKRSRKILSPPNIGSLRINCHKRLSNYEDLIAGLFWCCHPDIITACASNGRLFLKGHIVVFPTKDSIGSKSQFFIGELTKIIVEESETLSCCRDHRGFRCWRHYAILGDISAQLKDGLVKASVHWIH